MEIREKKILQENRMSEKGRRDRKKNDDTHKDKKKNARGMRKMQMNEKRKKEELEITE